MEFIQVIRPKHNRFKGGENIFCVLADSTAPENQPDIILGGNMAREFMEPASSFKDPLRGEIGIR